MMRMKSNGLVAVAVALVSLSLTACTKSSYKNTDAPDEFAVTRNAPLVVPPLVPRNFIAIICRLFPMHTPYALFRTANV